MIFITAAYIDPGAGAMLLQWLMAAVVGSVVFFRRGIARLFAALFRRSRPEKKDTTDLPPKNS